MLSEINAIKSKIDTYFVNASSTSDYKINHVLIGDTDGMYSDYVPCCAIIPQPSQRVETFIGQDTNKEDILVRFYVSAGHGDQSISDTSSGILKLISMCEMFKYVVRLDPTFNSEFVSCVINSINYYKSPMGSTASVRIAEISITCISRVLWNPNINS